MTEDTVETSVPRTVYKKETVNSSDKKNDVREYSPLIEEQKSLVSDSEGLEQGENETDNLDVKKDIFDMTEGELRGLDKDKLVKSVLTLRELADKDPLTELYNRRAFFREAERILELAKRREIPVAIGFLDLNKFKLINDNYGHDVGDEVLKLVSKGLLNTIRKSDFACRYGGDEFAALVLPGAKKGTRTSIETRLSNNIQKLVQQKRLEDPKFPDIEFSLGIEYIDINSSNPIQKAIKKADTEMYNKKPKDLGILENNDEPPNQINEEQ